MKVRWLGNSAIEIFGSKHILIDPNPVVPPKKKADIILITHEHDDHFSSSIYQTFGKDAEVYATKNTLDEFNLDGEPVKQGDRISRDIQVLGSDCWKSKDSVSYFYKGVLHSGDSANFPNPRTELKVIFSACFPDNYEEYIEDFKKLDPKLVVPFHYNPKEGEKDAKGLKKRLEEEKINSKIMEAGEIINTSEL